MPKKDDARQSEIMSAMVQEAKENCEYFIDEFVYIEDRDAETLAVKFSLWARQKATLALMVATRFLVALKARQLGMTWLALAYAVWMMLKPGKSIMAMSKTEEDSKELVRRTLFILRNLPEWFVSRSNVPRNDCMTYDSTATQITIYHPNGEPSTFKSFPASETSGASFTVNLLILDEWALQQYARGIWQSAFPTINRPTGGQVIGISTIRLGTLFEDIVRGAMVGANDFKLVFWPWDTDPRRDHEWYERTKRQMGEALMRQEYPASISEALESAGGRFFYELREDVHIKPKRESIPKDFKRYISLDYGTDMLAAIWYYVDYEGYARVYNERHQSGLSVTEASDLIKEAGGSDVVSAIFAPDDLWNTQSGLGKAAADFFADNGLRLTKTHRKREQGWVAVREWLRVHDKKQIDGRTIQTAKLTIDERAAPQLWRCLTTILTDKNNPRDAAKEPHDVTHMPDSLRAFCVYWQMPSKDTTPMKFDNSMEARVARDIARVNARYKHGEEAEYCR